jgi:hypothetical protein
MGVTALVFLPPDMAGYLNVGRAAIFCRLNHQDGLLSLGL